MSGILVVFRPWRIVELSAERASILNPPVRYRRGMTNLLEAALRRIELLSREEQNAIASQILETLDDEEAWARSFREKHELLRSLAQEAMEEHRRGETRPLDELLG
jgi:hypothetical protein